MYYDRTCCEKREISNNDIFWFSATGPLSDIAAMDGRRTFGATNAELRIVHITKILSSHDSVHDEHSEMFGRSMLSHFFGTSRNLFCRALSRISESPNFSLTPGLSYCEVRHVSIALDFRPAHVMKASRPPMILPVEVFHPAY